MNTKVLANIAGWTGSVAILASIAVMSMFGDIANKELLYYIFCFIGGIGICFRALYDKNSSGIVLNVIFCLMAIKGLWDLLF